MSRISFCEPPLIGFSIERGNQLYSLVGIRNHARRDGSLVALSEWLTRCPDCGAEFITTSPRKLLSDNRRCPAHTRPGRRVTRTVTAN